MAQRRGFRVEKPRRTLIIRAAREPVGDRPSPGLPLLVVGGQVVLTGLSAALASIWGVDAALALFFGGAVAFLPNAFFALAALALAHGKLPARVEAAALLGGWVAKLVLTVALLLIAIAVAKVGGGAFFVGLAVSLATPLALAVAGEQVRGAFGLARRRK